MSNLTISMRFAIDRDHNRRISKEEVVGFQDLDALDTTPDKVLRGSELEPVYFEYGKDRWLQAGLANSVPCGEANSVVNLRSITLDPPKIDLNVDISF